MSDKKVEVSYAVLHNAVFVKGLGQIDKTLDKGAFGSNRGFKLTVVNEQFLCLNIKDMQGIKPYQVFIPMTNVSHFVTAEPQ